jgi:hypothetical protein
MERQVFAKLTAYGDPGKAKSFAQIALVLTEFNAIREDDSNTNKFDPNDKNRKKLTLLNNALADFGFSGLNLLDSKKDSYSKSEGAKNREKNLCDEKNSRLSQSAYPGTILPTTPCPK